MDPISNLRGITPPVRQNQPPKKVQEVRDKIVHLLQSNGITTSNIKTSKGAIFIWIEPEKSDEQQKIIGILKANKFDQSPTTIELLTHDNVRVYVSINRNRFK